MIFKTNDSQFTPFTDTIWEQSTELKRMDEICNIPLSNLIDDNQWPAYGIIGYEGFPQYMGPAIYNHESGLGTLMGESNGVDLPYENGHDNQYTGQMSPSVKVLSIQGHAQMFSTSLILRVPSIDTIHQLFVAMTAYIRLITDIESNNIYTVVPTISGLPTHFDTQYMISKTINALYTGIEHLLNNDIDPFTIMTYPSKFSNTPWAMPIYFYESIRQVLVDQRTEDELRKILGGDDNEPLSLDFSKPSNSFSVSDKDS